MRLLSDLLWVVGVTIGSKTRGLPCAKAAPAASNRELADLMRRLPQRFAQRLPARTLDRIRAAAAAGRWESAVEILVTALRNRAEMITAQERAELDAVLSALNMPRAWAVRRKTPRQPLFARRSSERRG